ncbi:MAG: adenylate/guanylate cyclase domain-containing protein [Candidatus Rokubacteria bacterium]|nr:adenylate/guanylate cyclase domain-containing protein [Candidatus Rokubacteria bacterium]
MKRPPMAAPVVSAPDAEPRDDVRRTLERAADAMTSRPDPDPIVALVRERVDELLGPVQHVFRLNDEAGQAGRLVRERVTDLLVAAARERARADAALEAAHAELRAALRRVEILERIRANLAKFVPQTVQALIEQAPEAPALEKREADVSVLFVDIVGYTRLIERYFGAFLDEILQRGGDVNETAGDGLMVIFQAPDPRRHARAAVKTALGILRRTHEINATLAHLAEPIALHVGVNSGVATVGATKIEGMAGTRWVYTASGPVTNVAARLAALGEGDAVMVGAETRSRLDEEFTLEDLGEQRLRNVEHPVRVFRLSAPDKPSHLPEESAG